MNDPVFISAICRNAELLPASTMVFDTIRVGFPNSRVTVFINPLLHVDEIEAAAKKAECETIRLPTWETYHAWIKRLLATMATPFVVCDTDIVFWDEVEHWKFDEPLAGRYVPAFFDRFTGRNTHDRIHTSLMFLDPVGIYQRVAALNDAPPSKRLEYLMPPPLEVIDPLRHSIRDPITGQVQHWFHDTCSLLYHAIGGGLFMAEQLDCYSHLNCGTYSDIANDHVGTGLRAKHEAVFKNPELLRGAWRHQDAFYVRNPTTPNHSIPTP